VREGTILYLSERDVVRALDGVDPVAAVASALAAHARGETILPHEAYLGWRHDGESLRSLSMPAVFDGCAGVKIVNANPANPARGIARASGLTLLFDVATGRPVCIMEAAHISCVRTAAVTAVAADVLGAHPIERIAILGAGALARCHLHLLERTVPQLREIRLYDVEPERAAALAREHDVTRVFDSAEDTIRGAQLIVPVTTTTSGYIRFEWLEPGALLVNVSLDDPLPEIVLRADKVFVDDWPLVAADERRLLGRMVRAGQIRGPGSGAAGAGEGARVVDGHLGDVLTGALEGRARRDEIILVNPFGLAIEDIAVARRVYDNAVRTGLGTPLPR
jgi:N-[(2S)-2-amino-2-carboxyethyl]-L-glutamate dehydrogenase